MSINRAPKLTSNGDPIVHLDAPSEADGKPVVVMSPSTEGWMTWFSGAGDDLNPTPPASGRGQGQTLKVEFTDQDAAGKECVLEFLEPVEIHDGQLFYAPSDWSSEDRWDFFVRMPATVTTPNGTTTGNCNLMNLGGYNLIVPAAGDGTHDIDLAQAVPVPATGGYWAVDRVSGDITPSATPGSDAWHLFDIPIESFFMRNMPLGNPLGTFEIDTYKAEWLSQRWQLILKVYRNQAGAGTFEVAGWLMFFREKST